MPRRRMLRYLAPVLAVLLLLPAAGDGGDQNALAILNLRPTNFEAMGYNGEILYALISALEQEKRVELVPRREMEEVLSNAGMVQGDTPESAIEAGKALGINFVLFGNVTKTGATILANMSLMDVQNRQVLRSWTETYGSREAILAEIPGFARALVNTIESRDRYLAAAAPAKPAIEAPLFMKSVRAASRGKTVAVTWEASAEATVAGYNVYRSQDPDGPYQFMGYTDTPAFEDGKIRKGNTYYYRIGILTDSGEEVKTRMTAEIVKAGEKLPHPPLVLDSSGHVRRNVIRFVPSLINDQERFKIEAYRIYRKGPDGAQWAVVATIPAKVTSQTELGFTHEDTAGLADGMSYEYTITSIDKKDRESPRSDVVTVQTLVRPELRLETDGLLRKIELAWAAISGVEGYYLYRRTGSEEWLRVAKIRGEPRLPFVDDEGLEDGRRYDYYLTAYDADGETSPSNTVTAETKPMPPVPADLIARSGQVKSVSLVWTPIPDPDVGGYIVFRGTDPDDVKPLTKVRGHTADRFLDKGAGFSTLDDGTDYYYAVAGYNLFGAQGAVTPSVRARTKPRPKPPSGITLSADADRIRVTWGANPEPDIRTYALYRSRNNGVWLKVDEFGADKRVHTDTDLKPESRYRYRLIAIDADGLKSDAAESASIDSPVVQPET